VPPEGSSLRSWWPTTQSLDLVYGDIESVAAALEVEFSRFAQPEKIQTSWRRFGNLGAAFNSASTFDNVVTHVVALPTHSEWVVLWNNSFLCSGYDSLCWCLTTHHKLRTLHWSAHDEWTTFQSGASFTHRQFDGASVVERSVSSIQEDKRWIFHESGPVLPEEDSADYTARKRRDRLNEKTLTALLGRLGAEPWSDAFYDLDGKDAFVLSRPVPPKAISRTADQVIKAPV
jgi:hypothetical protein